MALSTRVRLVACLLGALAAGAVAAVRVAPLEPHLEFRVVQWLDDSAQDVFEVWMTPRGGERFEEVRVEPLRGATYVGRPSSTHDLDPDTRFRVRVVVSPPGDGIPAIRVTQTGRVSRTYDVDLVEAPR